MRADYETAGKHHEVLPNVVFVTEKSFGTDQIATGIKTVEGKNKWQQLLGRIFGVYTKVTITVDEGVKSEEPKKKTFLVYRDTLKEFEKEQDLGGIHNKLEETINKTERIVYKIQKNKTDYSTYFSHNITIEGKKIQAGQN